MIEKHCIKGAKRYFIKILQISYVT